MAQTVQGQYKGKDIFAGDDAYVMSQMQAIDAASQPITPAPQPQQAAVPQASTVPATQPNQLPPYQMTPTGAPSTSYTSQQTQQPTQQNIPQSSLQPGAQGAEVQQLQSMLQTLGYLTPQQIATGPGTYGPATTAAVAKLQKDLGVQAGKDAGYFGPKTKAALAAKYKDAFGNLSNTPVPSSPADARSAIDGFLSGQPGDEDKQKAYFEQLFNLNPVESAIFQQLSTLFTPATQQSTLMELFKQETVAQGIPELQMELADIKKIMDGTEDDIRAEITASGGFATESQVRALTGARNKTLLREAQYLSDVLQAKESYVDKVVQLTGQDREAVSAEMDRKLGIGKMMFDMTQTMQKNARENIQNIVKDIGYDGLVKGINTPQELQRIASAMGVSPSTLLTMSKMKTTDQRRLELDEMNYELSVDKFNEDTRRFGLSYALDVQKLKQAEIANKISQASLYSAERADRAINTAEAIKMRLVSKDAKGNLVFDKSKATQLLGTKAAIWGWKPDTPQYDLKTQVKALEAQIAQKELTEMREASKTGGAIGNASDKDMELLMASMGNLSTWQSPEQFYKTLNEVIDITAGWQAKKTLVEMGYDLKTYDKMIKDGWEPQEILQELNSL